MSEKNYGRHTKGSLGSSEGRGTSVIPLDETLAAALESGSVPSTCLWVTGFSGESGFSAVASYWLPDEHPAKALTRGSNRKRCRGRMGGPDWSTQLGG